MSGYTPLFETIATGTLYGRWPDIGLWPIVLALSDKHGVIDVTPHYLAGVTGLPVQEIVACMERFCAPDPYSRTKAEEGRRLRLIDQHRGWGWIVVNKSRYREKARLMAKDSARTESGQDADRKRLGRAEVPRSPPVSPEVPLSDADANPSKNPTARRKRAPSQDPAEFLDFKLTYPNRAGDQGWRKARRAWDARLAAGRTAAEMVGGAKRYAAYVRSTGNAGTEYVKQAGTFLGPDEHFLLPWDPPSKLSGKHGQPPAPERQSLAPRTDQRFERLKKVIADDSRLKSERSGDVVARLIPLTVRYEGYEQDIKRLCADRAERT